MVDVHTVGAGGGSIGWRDPGGALRVGPRSAGAEPGPACYGRGGTEPTVTDANLLLGHLAADSRARRRRRPRRRGGASARSARSPASLGLDELETAEGIVRVANQEMVRALRVVTVERGVDPRGFALLPFGGAGPMHAAAIAAELGIERILCPRAGGVLSALGLCASERRRDTARTVMLSGEELSAERIAAEVDELIAARRRRPRRTPSPRSSTRCATPARPSSCRSPARPSPTRPTSPSASSARTRSATATATPTARSSSSTSAWRWSRPGPRPRPRRAPAGSSSESARRVRFGGEWVETPVLRGEPAAGHRGRGPGRLRAARGDPGPAAGLARRGRRGRHDRARSERRRRRNADERLDPITLQVLIGGLRAACDEMGAALIRSAYSANIKERHDCSTALFDAARRAGDAGRAHPRPPRLDARRGRRRARRGAAARAAPGSSTTPTAAAPTCPTSP